MSLWTPGADLGEYEGPQPDERIARLGGGMDEHGHMRPMTYRRLREFVDQDWTVTAATPEGPTTLLKTTRDMFCLGFYSYELIAASCSWSLFAVEAALKLRLNVNKSFNQLVELAEQQGLITQELGETIDAGREIRNNFVHEGKQPMWTPGMAGEGIGASFRFVAELYPDTP